MSEMPLVLGLVPTILLPLVLLSVVITTIATYVAGFFGIELKTEGPRRLLEVLLKPRLLIYAIVLNIVAVAVVKYVRYARFFPERLSRIEAVQKEHGRASEYEYANTTFSSHRRQASPIPEKRGAFDIDVAWTTSLSDGCYEKGSLSGDSLFLGSFDGHIYELDVDSGDTRRRFYVGTQVTPAPFIWENRIYTGEGVHLTHHARVYAFDLAKGSFLNAFSTKGHTEGQSVVASHRGRALLFSVAGNDGVYALDPITMTQVWHQVHGHVDGAVRVANGRVFVGSGAERDDKKHVERTVSAYRFNDGDVLWQKAIPASSWMAPLVSTDAVYFALGEFYKESSFGQLVGFAPENGEVVLEIATQAPLCSPPIRVGNRIYVSDRNEQINCFDLDAKACLWTRATVVREDQTSAAGVSYDPYRDVLLYPSFKNGLYILDPETGETLSHWLPDATMPAWEDSYSAVIVTEDAWYMSDAAGTVRRLTPKKRPAQGHAL